MKDGALARRRGYRRLTGLPRPLCGMTGAFRALAAVFATYGILRSARLPP